MQSNPTPHRLCLPKEEISDKVTAAARNDAGQILCVFLESFSLERIDLVADDADYRYCCPLSRRRGECIRAESRVAHIAEMHPMASRRVNCAVDNSVECMFDSLPVYGHKQFVYCQIMNVEYHTDAAVARVAAAIGEPARTRILYCLMDGHARTSTELSVAAEVSPSTASVHLNRLQKAHLVKVFVQGKHRFYSLEGPNVATVLEGLSVLVGGSHAKFVPSNPSPLRAARTCYDAPGPDLAGARPRIASRSRA
jgi:DNA-binding transcriptional ArsR family regulator